MSKWRGQEETDAPGVVLRLPVTKDGPKMDDRSGLPSLQGYIRLFLHFYIRKKERKKERKSAW